MFLHSAEILMTILVKILLKFYNLRNQSTSYLCSKNLSNPKVFPLHICLFCLFWILFFVLIIMIMISDNNFSHLNFHYSRQQNPTHNWTLTLDMAPHNKAIISRHLYRATTTIATFMATISHGNVCFTFLPAINSKKETHFVFPFFSLLFCCCLFAVKRRYETTRQKENTPTQK